ncbi:MAG TPA: VOC family protein [Stellaceae bacterium]|nr:VOC family protein [Stellaceae bacterium]
MKHAIDHLVLCVDDLDRARRFYEALGFRLTPRAQHPFGTANHLAQLQGSFLELLAVADRARIPAAQPGYFNFAAFAAAFLGRHQGLSMLVFPSDDARADQRQFLARGLETYAPFDFSRKASLPDGGEAVVGFSLAFVTNRAMPETAFFVCQQHAPEHFWKPEFQRHENGAVAAVEALMVAEAPRELADFFGRLVEPRRVGEDANALHVHLDGAAITVLDRAHFKARFPTADHDAGGEGPRFAGYGVAVTDLARVETILRQNEIPFRRAGDRLHVSDRDAFGTVIEFSAGGASP